MTQPSTATESLKNPAQLAGAAARAIEALPDATWAVESHADEHLRGIQFVLFHLGALAEGLPPCVEEIPRYIAELASDGRLATTSEGVNVASRQADLEAATVDAIAAARLLQSALARAREVVISLSPKDS
ncbi:hypothetical protein ACIGN6_32175 [Streptomyces sp. NPDC053792]|uniref:hypothetical protein n=1 Tax=Streptomyces sp. NPDC053792 TaxID=3365716 RepID=UPI0037D001CA